jgi:hypothetical protein
MLKCGRHILPPDIEAHLAPDNYLFAHSLMFTATSKPHRSGIHAGDDIAPWDAAAHPTGSQWLAECPGMAPATTERHVQVLV